MRASKCKSWCTGNKWGTHFENTSHKTFDFFPIYLSARYLSGGSLSIIWWWLWITACTETFGRLWAQETMHLNLSKQTAFFYYYSFLSNSSLWDGILCPSDNQDQVPSATETSLQLKVFLTATEVWDKTTGTSIALIDKNLFYHYFH